MAVNKPTFGTLLRATRLNFVWWEKLGCFIRVSDFDQHWLVELRPNMCTGLNVGGKGKTYRKIEDVEAITSASPVLSNIKSVDRSIDLLLDDLGQIVD